MNIRVNKPEAGNKYYIRKVSGGLNGAIQGKPTDKCDVLANCVGYANGRFAEIMGEFKYQFVSNAENFIEHAKSYGLEIGQTPKEGAIMVWQKGNTLDSKDGAGHVCIVERVNNDGSVYTSESGYNSKAFWNATRTNKNGRWGQASSYIFRGFIYNPAIKDIEPEPIPEPEPEPIPTPTPTPTIIKEGDTVIVNGVGTADSYGGGAKTKRFNNRKMKVIAIREGRKNAYACNQYNEGKVRDYSKVTAWFSRDSLSK